MHKTHALTKKKALAIVLLIGLVLLVLLSLIHISEPTRPY